jgi:hypothetical protein
MALSASTLFSRARVVADAKGMKGKLLMPTAPAVTRWMREAKHHSNETG